jgi:hypothetical protein
MSNPVDEIKLRNLVTNHLNLESTVSSDEAFCLIESLILKERNGQLRQPEKQFLDRLKEDGLVPS